MATALEPESRYAHIVATPGVRGGKPRIDGTRICVVDIALLHEQGMKPAEMLEYHSSRPLTLAEVHSALAYYFDHREEVEEYWSRSEEAAREIKRDPAAYLARISRE